MKKLTLFLGALMIAGASFACDGGKDGKKACCKKEEKASCSKKDNKHCEKSAKEAQLKKDDSKEMVKAPVQKS
jgi:hypothetical protein